jgi:hypothetical protein
MEKNIRALTFEYKKYDPISIKDGIIWYIHSIFLSIKECGLPLRSLSYSPSNHSLSMYLLHHLLTHTIDLCNSCAIDYICCLFIRHFL